MVFFLFGHLQAVDTVTDVADFGQAQAYPTTSTHVGKTTDNHVFYPTR